MTYDIQIGMQRQGYREMLPYLIDSKKTADEVNSYEKQAKHNDNFPFSIHL